MTRPMLFLALGLLSIASCVPKRDLPPNEIAKLTKLTEVMDVQATIADPQFKKIGEASYADADWASFTDLGSRIQVTAGKAKEFSKGPEFDKLADQLAEKAKALSTAATAKDAAAASTALTDMKATCKTCHSKFK